MACGLFARCEWHLCKWFQSGKVPSMGARHSRQTVTTNTGASVLGHTVSRTGSAFLEDNQADNDHLSHLFVTCILKE